MKQDETRRLRNRHRRSTIKTQVRQFLEAVHDKDAPKASEQFQTVTRLLDQSAAKGTYHKNTVSRKKSRLAARLNALTGADA